MAQDPKNQNVAGEQEQGSREENQEAAIWVYVGDEAEEATTCERLHIVIERPRPTAAPFILRTSPDADAIIIQCKLSGPTIEELKKRALAKALIAEAALMGALKVVKIGNVPDLEPDMQAWAPFRVGKRRARWFRIERDRRRDNPREYVIFPIDPPSEPPGPIDGDEGLGPKGRRKGGPSGAKRGRGQRPASKRPRQRAAARSGLILYKFIRMETRRWISAAKAEFSSRSQNSLVWLKRVAVNVVRILYKLDATILDLSQSYSQRAQTIHSVFTHRAQLPADTCDSGAVLKPRFVGSQIGLSLMLFSFALDEEIEWGADLFGVDWSQDLFGSGVEEGPMAA